MDTGTAAGADTGTWGAGGGAPSTCLPPQPAVARVRPSMGTSSLDALAIGTFRSGVDWPLHPRPARSGSGRETPGAKAAVAEDGLGLRREPPAPPALGQLPCLAN